MKMKLAAITNPALSEGVGTGDPTVGFNTLLTNTIDVVLLLGVIVSLAYLIIGAISFITAGEDKVKMSAAKGKISTSLIGLVILFSTFAIMKVVGTVFGIPGLRDLLFDLSPFFLLD